MLLQYINSNLSPIKCNHMHKQYRLLFISDKNLKKKKERENANSDPNAQ